MIYYNAKNASGEDVTLVVRSRTGTTRELVFKAGAVIRGLDSQGKALLESLVAGPLIEITRVEEKPKPPNWLSEGF